MHFYFGGKHRMNSRLRLKVDRHRGSPRKAVLAALEAALHNGRISTADALCPQRLMSDFMGVRLNTVNGAMREAARRGGTAALIRRGTTVIARPTP
jgi:GntR family transcriptional regulator